MTFKLTSLTVAGFRNFQEPQHFNFCSPSGEPVGYFVFSGPNGCGKTAVLEAIVLALGREDLLTLSYDEELTQEHLREPEHVCLGLHTSVVAHFVNDGRDLLQVHRTRFNHFVSEGCRADSPPLQYISSRRVSKSVFTRNDEERQKVEQFWQTFKKDATIPYTSGLSSGEAAVLDLVVPLILNPFEGLLLIDEPELHLHPQWQGHVVRAVRAAAPKAQVIVASHADDPWDDAMSWERCLLLPSNDPRLVGHADGA